MIPRILRLPAQPTESFFLWGPRQVGKSSLLRETYPSTRRLDLLLTEEYVRYTQRPGLLREELADALPGTLTIVDEVQKVPALLDEVHWLIENRGLTFGLCGSSARKVRRGHANLLGGRAVRHELFGFVSAEMGDGWEIERALNHGCLPRHYLDPRPARLLRAYVDDYLKEEIAAEGLVQNLPAFSDFLRGAALADTELVSFTNIARECGVSSNTVKAYYQILVDTLVGRFVPAYRARPKRRVIQAPKFYFADVGVVNHLARRGRLQRGGELFGKGLENLIHHELTAYLEYQERLADLTFWRLASGVEVDFVIADLSVAIEVKATGHPGSHHLRGLRAIREDHPEIDLLILVCLDSKRRMTEDGIEILPVAEFLGRLWTGELLG
ncbi:MAG: DUF4143 domain-containing protein [Gemmatimonadetes bacterium]|nr:DUF4143 domain-containing protein [Gemmatimonadota bacterium]